MSGSPSEALASSPLASGKREKKPRLRDPVEHDVYAGKAEGDEDNGHRRVIAVRDGRVCYSIGSNMNHWCNLKTFRRWMRGASLVHDATSKI